MTHPCVLPAELAIYGVAELAQAWQAWVVDDPATPVLTVDASAPADVDGAGVQLLISLSNALHQQGRSLALRAPSAALVAACERLGAAFLLEAAAVPADSPAHLTNMEAA